jgi:hypothetical protein
MTLCECGCGQPAPIATKTRSKLGHVKGGPIRFVYAHHLRLHQDKCAKFLRTRRGPLNHHWNGGRTIDRGYVLIRAIRWPASGVTSPPNRLVMAEAIGRMLRPEEVVHHINEIKTDNRLENLMD